MAKAQDDTDDLEGSGHLREWYREPAALLAFEQTPLDKVGKDCVFVLDANVLLLPYASASKPFKEVVGLYERLVSEKRLFVPAQAMREFLKLRSSKLGEIHTQLLNFKSSLSIPKLPRIPILLEDSDYKQADEAIKKLQQDTTAKSAIDAIIDRLRGPVGSDDVSAAYRRLFSENILDETDRHNDEAWSELKQRYSQKRPPGYADASKPDGGIGDLLIWRSILRLGEERKQHCVFVSSDRKRDWWGQSSGPFQPRLELIEEYRVASKGQTLHLALLGDVLDLIGATPETVKEVRSIETPDRGQNATALVNRYASLTHELSDNVSYLSQLRSQMDTIRRLKDNLDDQEPALELLHNLRTEENNITDGINELRSQLIQIERHLSKLGTVAPNSFLNQDGTLTFG